MPPNQAESLSIAAQLAALLARPVSVQERERACAHLLDWFGCAAAGTVSEAAAPLRAWAANAAPQECALLTGGAASLSAALIVNGALGNAGTQAAGLWQMRHEDTDTKQLHTGHAALVGVTAAELAQHKFRGPQYIFEGPQGFFAAMCGGASAQAIVSAPDAPWKIAEVSFKPWPACRHVHAAIDCALELRAQLSAQMSAADIATVTVQTYAAAVTFCDQPQPRTSLEAKFSFQQAMAVVLLHGTPTLAMFEPAAINDPAIAALRAKVRVEEAARYTGAYPSHFGSSAYRELLKRKLGIETLVELVAPGELKAITGIDSRQKPVRLIDESRK